MDLPVITIITSVTAIIVWSANVIRKKIRQKKLLLEPFPSSWETILTQHFPLYKVLPENLKFQLQNHIRIFIDEKNFEGQAGLSITDEIRIIIAAQACILLLNRKTRYYPKLRTIIVYPHHYVSENGDICNGESWTFGPVVLSWNAVKHGVSDMHDGRNVVFHEFAHQLDQEDGVGDGTPILPDRSNYQTWTTIFSSEYKKHVNDIFDEKETILRAYGTVHPAEFFAVTAEAFFEKPQKMKANHPELYDEMKSFFHVDPATWFEK